VTFRTYFRTFRRYLRDRAPRDDGFALIEVIISAMLVGLIVIATLTGFESVGRATADERFHDQAALLLSEAQEALRSDPANAFDTLVAETKAGEPHTYTMTLGGGTGNETYTITQSAVYIENASQALTCSTGSKSTPALNIQVTSSVTWPQLLAAGRKALTQSSVITPPDGSGLQVDVLNEETNPITRVEGATVNATEGATSSSATTSKEGCVVFAALPSTTVNLEVYKPGYVSPGGEYKVIAKEVSIAPNLTTHRTVTLEEGGAIEAEFLYNKLTEFGGMPVTGDTFVVSNTKMGIQPEFELGSTKITTFANGTYEALTGTYEHTAKTPISAEDYPNGNLFPFATSGWSVYAGDCTENKPPTSVVTEEEANNEGKAAVQGGETIKVKIPTSYVNVSVYSGTEKTPGKLETTGETANKEEPYAVKITNKGAAKECKITPNNSAKEESYAHLQHVLTTKENAAHAGFLQAPFQPFGKFELCVWAKTAKKTYTISYENKTVAGTKDEIFLSASGSKSGTSKEGMTVKTEQNTNTC
jgi:type II secretory pathway pseudopilin PulG